MGPDGVMYETVEIPKPDNDYLVLELLNKETNAIESKFNKSSLMIIFFYLKKVIQIINMATKNVIKIVKFMPFLYYYYYHSRAEEWIQI